MPAAHPVSFAPGPAAYAAEMPLELVLPDTVAPDLKIQRLAESRHSSAPEPLFSKEPNRRPTLATPLKSGIEQAFRTGSASLTRSDMPNRDRQTWVPSPALIFR
jgi:hypothetical protein